MKINCIKHFGWLVLSWDRSRFCPAPKWEEPRGEIWWNRETEYCLSHWFFEESECLLPSCRECIKLSNVQFRNNALRIPRESASLSFYLFKGKIDESIELQTKIASKFGPPYFIRHWTNRRFSNNFTDKLHLFENKFVESAHLPIFSSFVFYSLRMCASSRYIKN